MPVSEPIVITHPVEDELNRKDVFSWPVWEKEKSVFPWVYGTEETAYFVEGKVKVTARDGTVYNIGKGDFVVFPVGLECTWEIIEPVSKRYSFT